MKSHVGRGGLRSLLISACAVGLLALTLIPAPRASAASAEVHTALGHNTLGGSNTFQITLASVTRGDLIVATAGVPVAGVNMGVSDGQNNWVKAALQCTGYNGCAEVWYTGAKNSGNLVMTFSTSDTADYMYVFVIEFSGASFTMGPTKVNSGPSGNPYVASLTPPTGGVVVAVAAGPSGWGVQSPYNMVGGSTGWSAAAEWTAPWGGGSTQAPFTATYGAQWAEAVVTFYQRATSPPYQGVTMGGWLPNPQNSCVEKFDLINGANTWGCTQTASQGGGYASTANIAATTALSCDVGQGANCGQDTYAYIDLNQQGIQYVYHASSSNQVALTMTLGYNGRIYANGGTGSIKLNFLVYSCPQLPCSGSPTVYPWTIMSVSASGGTAIGQGFSGTTAYTLVIANPTVGNFYGFYGEVFADAEVSIPPGVQGSATVDFTPQSPIGQSAFYMSILGISLTA